MKTAKQANQTTEGARRGPFIQRQCSHCAKEKEEEAPFISSSRVGRVQSKLAVGQPGDQYEREADQMADYVMRMPVPGSLAPIISRIPPAQPHLQRLCAECEDEIQPQPSNTLLPSSELIVQRNGNGDKAATQTSSDLSNQLQRRQGRGERLPQDIQTEMENAFGTDFSGVRVHRDSEAMQMSQELNAQAFTHGSNIYFDHGKYSPSESLGKRLLVHELMHVVQQSSGNFHSRSKQVFSKSSSIPQIMRTAWESYSEQPSTDYLRGDIFPVDIVNLGPIRANTRNCAFTPLFQVPNFGVPNQMSPLNRLTIRATAMSSDGRYRISSSDEDWSMDIFEAYSSTSPGAGSRYYCDTPNPYRNHRAAGHLNETLTIVYPSPPALWSTRNLFIRFRNGSGSRIISANIHFEYPQPAAPDASEQFWDSIQRVLGLLGMTPWVGIIFDGIDFVISAARGRWVEAGFAAMAILPGLGDAARAARVSSQIHDGIWLTRSIHSGNDVIGYRISQDILRAMSADDIVRAIRESSSELARVSIPSRLERVPRSLGRRRGPVDNTLLTQALYVRTHLVGITYPLLHDINVAAARVRIGDEIEYITFRNTRHDVHSETWILSEVERIRNNHPSVRVIVEQVFTERAPCRGLHNCSGSLRLLERSQISQFGNDGQLAVFYGSAELDAQVVNDLRVLWGLEQ
ncbi:nucleic acid/nucleotide deaminase of polymorphic system toxin [Nitrosomonas nitrosa]|uniref:eCIS core domain-containing protein n=1 Tax=Nitrosomonas nitrosa TaxID=52442 RepID=UPI000D316876|nr:DUF4157 domain-containing protein [Nitrosomonas nitrosa]PTQ91923.1 nucleic acid/nucleotide deaminase of polymorphic system toxin [Nitrosomonas nitrosa]